jgi:hypothetical protein
MRCYVILLCDGPSLAGVLDLVPKSVCTHFGFSMFLVAIYQTIVVDDIRGVKMLRRVGARAVRTDPSQSLREGRSETHLTSFPAPDSNCASDKNMAFKFTKFTVSNKIHLLELKRVELHLLTSSSTLAAYYSYFGV